MHNRREPIVVLAVSSTPDESLLKAGGTLVGLARTGTEVVSLMCGTGQSGRRLEGSRRLCARANFVAESVASPLDLDREFDREAVVACLRTEIVGALRRYNPDLVVAPARDHGPPSDEAVGQAVHEAVTLHGGSLWTWSLWGRDTRVLSIVSPIADEDAGTVVAALGEWEPGDDYTEPAELRWKSSHALARERFPACRTKAAQATRVELLHETWCQGGRWHAASSPRVLTERPTVPAPRRLSDYPYEWIGAGRSAARR